MSLRACAPQSVHNYVGCQIGLVLCANKASLVCVKISSAAPIEQLFHINAQSLVESVNHSIRYVLA